MKKTQANTNYITEVKEDTMPYHPFSIQTIKRQDSSKINLKTRRSHGPSGLDACEWRRILTQFNQTSIELCKTIAKPSYTKASKVLLHENLTPYNSCRLLTLDKNPGSSPIDIGEVLRRIIGKRITQCIKSGVENPGKFFQLCSGQKCGIKNAFPGLNEIEKPETDAILFIDAENAFISLNRNLLSGTTTCPGQLTS